jgi:hypothetical protein
MKTTMLGAAILVFALAPAAWAKGGHGGHGGGHGGHHGGHGKKGGRAHHNKNHHNAHHHNANHHHANHHHNANHHHAAHHDHHFRYGFGRGGRFGYNFGLRRGFNHAAYFRNNAVRFNGGYYYAGRNHNNWTWSYYSPGYGSTFYYDPGASSWYYWYAPQKRYYPASYVTVLPPTPNAGPQVAVQAGPPAALPDGAGKAPPPPPEPAAPAVANNATPTAQAG